MNQYATWCSKHPKRFFYGESADDCPECARPVSRDIIRRCRFAPYRKGMGPTFQLELWDTGRMMDPYHSLLGYCLVMYAEGERWVLFRAEDYGVPSHQAIDSDAAVRSLMTFLTLRPGDTDSEYFASYDELQREYCDHHAETLSTYMLLGWRGGDPEYR